MTKVKTRVGEIECPDIKDIGPRTKYWAEAIYEVIRTEELYMVMGAALEEAYKVGRIDAVKAFMSGLGKMEVVDAEFEVIDEKRKVVEGTGQKHDDEGELEGSTEVAVLGQGGGGDAGASGEAPRGPEPEEPATDEPSSIPAGPPDSIR